MVLTIDRFQKAKEKFINEIFVDDGTEEARKCKLACLLIPETFIENWFLNNEENADVDKETFSDFAGVQVIALINSGLNQGQLKENIKTSAEILLAFIHIVYEMYFEENVVGTC